MTGIAIGSTHFIAQADDAWGRRDSKDGSAATASSRAPLIGVRLINTMIDDALRDGKLDASERDMILSQAKRMLNTGQVADVEARLNDMGRAATKPAVRLGAPVEMADASSAPTPITRVGLENPVETNWRHTSPSKNATNVEPYAMSDADHGDGAAAGCCGDSCSTCLLDNLYLFAAVDAWRGPLDGDQSSNFGGRIGFNAGMPLLQSCGIGMQMGMSYGAYDFHGRFELEPDTEKSAIEEQLFFTAGFFKHCNVSNGCCADRISWGIVYDRMITDNTSAATQELSLGQFRGQIGYACDACNEVGLWGSFGDGSSKSFDALGVKHTTQSIDQLNVYWRHKWCNNADTRAYVGIAEEPGEFVFGAQGQLPLNDCWALFSGFHYILPSANGGPPGFREEVWNVTAGIAFYPGGHARTKTVCGECWQPLLPVADNGNFALDLNF